MFHFLLKHIPRPLLIRLSYLGRFFFKLWYVGSRHEDPISGEQFRCFLPYGYGGITKRKNALAPGTLSLERHRLLWLFLKQKTAFFDEPIRLLHVAPEQCFYGRFRKMTNVGYVTADLNSPIADIKMDLHDIPLEDDAFDVIFCNHVLEHVRDDRRCMRELCRVMKPGGWGIFQVPMDVNRQKTFEDPTVTDPQERERLFWQKDHVRLYGRDYKNRLEESGFEVEIIDFLSTLGREKTERFRLRSPSNDNDIYLVRKPNTQ